MTIVVAVRPRRKLVAWLRTSPPVAAAALLAEYGYAARSFEPSDQIALGVVSAVVFTHRPDEPGELMKDLRENAARFLDSGCRVLVRVEPDFERTYSAVLKAAKLPVANAPPEFVFGSYVDAHPCVRLARTVDGDSREAWKIHGPFLMDSDEDPVQHAVRLLGPRAKDLSEARVALLTRAFSDCKQVLLSDMPQGRSGASVLLAYPTIERPLSGEGAPLVVKFDERDAVAREHENYESHLRPFVPYHLGPHLAARRCCLGAQEGALVTTFVEESESLLSCAIAGRSVGLVSALLDRTLAGWWRSAREQDVDYGLELDSQLPNFIEPARTAEARKLGAKFSLEELRARVRSLGTQRSWYGHVHGDLHAENVRARAGDAVLIDFGKCTTGSLLIDPAILEASLLVGDVDAERRAGHDVSFTNWQRRTRLLYERAELANVSRAVRLGNHWDWLHSAIREIRLHAMSKQCVNGQYALALGVTLVRAAARRVGKDRRPLDSKRRAFAYVLGEQLITMEWS